MEDGSRVTSFSMSRCLLDWSLSASPLLDRNRPSSGCLLPCPVRAPGRMHIPGSTVLGSVARLLVIDGLFVTVRIWIDRFGSGYPPEKRSVGQRSNCRIMHWATSSSARESIKLSSSGFHFEMRGSRSRSRSRARAQRPREVEVEVEVGRKREGRGSARMPAAAIVVGTRERALQR